MFSIKNITQSGVGGFVFGEFSAENAVWKMDRPIKYGTKVAIKGTKKFYREIGVDNCGVFNTVNEINFFRRLSTHTSDKIVLCLGILENAKQSVLFFECADEDLYSYFFEATTYKTKLSEDDVMVVLDKYVAMVDSVLQVLETFNIVYCDWKPQNILCFGERLKLCDFGSCLVADVTVQNPKNINRLFGSPNLSPCFTTLTPTKYDDYKGAAYLYHTMAGASLPWLTLRGSAEDGICTSLCLDETILLLKSMPHLFKVGFDIKHNRPWLKAIDEIVC